jgi:transposase
MRARGEVSDADWAVLDPLLRFPRRAGRRGRPRADTREVLNGVLWILRTEAQWRELPSMHPPYQTVHGRFQWVRSGQLEKALRILTEKLRQKENWIRAREPRSWPSPRKQRSSGCHDRFAWPHESKLVDETLAGGFLDELPEKLIGDKAHDSDPLDRHLDEEYGIEMIALNRQNRSKTQDGRALRPWVVWRPFAWLHWFRRPVVRYEFHAENFLGMTRLHEDHVALFVRSELVSSA